MNIQHESKSDSWRTPPQIIEMARVVLGNIDLDPASSHFANRFVGARRYYTRRDDGLKQDWSGSVFLNPPGGKLGNKSKAALFWEKLISSNIDHAIFIGFSLECLAVTQQFKYSVMDYPICVPSKRIRFLDPNDSEARPSSPSHANVIVYVPGHLDRTEYFINVFRNLGKCKV